VPILRKEANSPNGRPILEIRRASHTRRWRQRQELAAGGRSGKMGAGRDSKMEPVSMARRLQAMQVMQIAPNYRHWMLGTLGAAMLHPAAAAAPRADLQDIAALESLAKSEAMRQFPPLSDRQRFLIGPIEPNLELERCQLPVAANLTSAHHMQDRATIELRCPTPKSWHIYVQARIIGTSTVAVAAHAIVMGSVLKAADLRVEQHDISELPLGFLDDPSIAVGLTASRPIPGGAFITNQQLVAAKAVQRGQSVTLVADAGGMSVRMAGKALSDGLVNQRVKVANLSSGKVVEGIARSEQVVEIISQ
jgi:flagella basal body P-ring formation protein FlgA